MFRVWTKDFGGGVTTFTDWQSFTKCKRFIVGRWGHWPPFAFISKAKDRASFVRYNGE